MSDFPSFRLLPSYLSCIWKMNSNYLETALKSKSDNLCFPHTHVQIKNGVFTSYYAPSKTPFSALPDLSEELSKNEKEESGWKISPESNFLRNHLRQDKIACNKAD